MESIPVIENEIRQEAVLLERAKFSDRFFAAFVDNIIIFAPLKFLYNVVTPFWDGLSAVLLLGFLLPLAAMYGYFAVYAQKNNGQTLGKKWNKIKVVDKEGNNLSLEHFLKRESFVRGVVIITSLFVGIFSNLWFITFLIALSKKKLALHDIIAGTQVIKLKD